MLNPDFGRDARNPAVNSKLSPGSKKPISKPDSAKIIAHK
jgi:hypothetical protein